MAQDTAGQTTAPGRSPTTGRFGSGNKFGNRFAEGNQAAQGNPGPPSSEVRAVLREAGWAAIPRIKEIAADPDHKDHYKALTWLAERGLRDDLESRQAPTEGPGVRIPQWGPFHPPAGNVSIVKGSGAIVAQSDTREAESLEAGSWGLSGGR